MSDISAFNVPPILAHAIEIVLLALIASVALGAGIRLLRIMGAGPLLSLGERVIFGLALGFGTLSLAMLATGLLGVIYLPAGMVVLAALAALAVRPLIEVCGEALPAIRHAFNGLRYPPNLFLALVIGLAIASALAKALVPAATQDDLMYHLALPRRYVEAHAISFYPDSSYSLFPQAMEMLYTWGLLLGSDRISVLLAFGMGLLGPAAAALFARRYLGGDRPGIWSAMPLLCAAIFLTTPLVGFILRAANTDLAQASFDLLALYAFWLFLTSNRQIRRCRARGDASATPEGAPAGALLHQEAVTPLRSELLALSGVCAGLAFSTKYYGFATGTFIGGLLLVLLLAGGTKQFPRLARSTVSRLLIAFGLPFACLAAVWLLRNLAASGNPVWPLAGGVFDGKYWSPDASPDTLLGLAPGLSPASIPVALSDMWFAMTRGPLLMDGQTYAVDLGPILITALLALLFVRWPPALRLLGVAAAWYWLLWTFFFSHTSARYLSTFFLFAALLGAYGLVALAARAGVLRWTLGGLAAIVLGVLSIQAALGAVPYLPTTLAFDRSAEESYLAKYMEDKPILDYIKEHTPPGAVVYVWDGQPRGYYVERPYIYARLVPLYSGFGGPPEAWRARLRELGVAYLLVHNRDRLAPGQPAGQDPFAAAEQQFVARYFGPLLDESGTYALYELKP